MLAIHVGNFDYRDIKCAAAQVIHRYLAIALFLIHTKGKRSRRRLIDNAFDVESSNASCILSRLAL